MSTMESERPGVALSAAGLLNDVIQEARRLGYKEIHRDAFLLHLKEMGYERSAEWEHVNSYVPGSFIAVDALDTWLTRKYTSPQVAQGGPERAQRQEGSGNAPAQNRPPRPDNAPGNDTQTAPESRHQSPDQDTAHRPEQTGGTQSQQGPVYVRKGLFDGLRMPGFKKRGGARQGAMEVDKLVDEKLDNIDTLLGGVATQVGIYQQSGDEQVKRGAGQTIKSHFDAIRRDLTDIKSAAGSMPRERRQQLQERLATVHDNLKGQAQTMDQGDDRLKDMAKQARLIAEMVKSLIQALAKLFGQGRRQPGPQQAEAALG